MRFPHQAYGTQLGFMSKVIQALEGGQNALLEAPTGPSQIYYNLSNTKMYECFSKIAFLPKHFLN